MIPAVVVLLILFFWVLVKEAQASEPGAEAEVRGAGTESIRDLIIRVANSEGVNPAIILAIAEIESSFNPEAVNPLDPSYGLCQITPALAQDYGLVKDYKSPTDEEIKNLVDPEVNVRIACRHIKRLLSKYSLDVAVQMYNVGVRGYLELGRRALGYLERFNRAFESWSARLVRV